MRVGDRVHYVGDTRPDWHGIPATVTSIGHAACVQFDRPWEGQQDLGSGIALENLEPLNMIDPKRPVQTTENPPHLCRTIGVLERTEGVKTLLLSVQWTYDSFEIEIDLNGKPVLGNERGGALTFCNQPKIESGFYPLDNTGRPTDARGLVTLSLAKGEYKRATHFLEIIRTDGIPTEAKIHGPDTPPT